MTERSHKKTLQFASGELVNEILANNWVKNVEKIEKNLKVKLSILEGDITIESSDPILLDQAVRFFLLCEKSVKEGCLTQSLFETYLEGSLIPHLNDFFEARIKVSPRKKDVVPKTLAQLRYIQQLRKKEVVFGLGPAGTGKTYLAMAMAVNELLAGNVTRLILTRPAREAGENLGFLPGTLEEKIMPYLRPLYDALYEMMDAEEVSQLSEKKVIEIAPLAFMRGRTLNNAFIILDEAQNATADQLLMFLTRLGFNSKCVITGDPMQSDLPLTTPSGLMRAKRNFAHLDEIGFTEFTTQDVVRHRLVEKMIIAWKGNVNEV